MGSYSDPLLGSRRRYSRRSRRSCCGSPPSEGRNASQFDRNNTHVFAPEDAPADGAPADDPFAVDPNAPTEPEPPGEGDLAEALAQASAAPVAPEPKPAKKRRKPAKLKLAYPRADSMVEEYRENLERGGCFIRTQKPLKEGRECRIEVRAPGLDTPMVIEGVVSWSSAGTAELEPGQQAGMEIEYRLDDVTRDLIAATLDSLA